ncbi:MAG: succinate dehydrogenase cytochrome b subunit [Verrucomicrobia bacterium]|nr:succinate dehydrogenase cytochrome b subunit [Verrucomicrobiota bacterium]
MKIVLSFFQSSLGKKCVMAITGLALFAFVIGHMLGNLQIFLGRDQINAYAVFLKSKPAMLWTARIGLLIMVILHIVSAVQLARMNQAARPVPYGNQKVAAASYASRTMLMSGLIIFAFVIYHLLHFTLAVPEVNLLAASNDFPNANFLELKDAQGRQDVYQMMVRGYSNPLVAGFYVLAMALLCLHLSHGVSSMFQSIGLKNKRFGGLIDRFAIISAILIFIGNCSIPIAILFGYGK